MMQCKGIREGGHNMEHSLEERIKVLQRTTRVNAAHLNEAIKIISEQQADLESMRNEKEFLWSGAPRELLEALKKWVEDMEAQGQAVSRPRLKAARSALALSTRETFSDYGVNYSGEVHEADPCLVVDDS